MNRPLESVRVLALTRALSGPFCTMILGDLGADVVKVASTGGEMIRNSGPFHDGVGVFYLSVNRNKRSLSLDLRKPEGLAVLRDFGLSEERVASLERAGVVQTSPVTETNGARS
ncbi:MAG: CoA transferase [Gammaproteobacteria bacterium]